MYVSKAEVDRLVADVGWEPFPLQYHIQWAWKHFLVRNRVLFLETFCMQKRSLAILSKRK